MYIYTYSHIRVFIYIYIYVFVLVRETDVGHVGSKQNMTLIDLRGHPSSLKAEEEALKAVGE